MINQLTDPSMKDIKRSQFHPKPPIEEELNQDYLISSGLKNKNPNIPETDLPMNSSDENLSQYTDYEALERL